MVTSPHQKDKKSPITITINEKWCKNCGLCVTFCPRGVFSSDEFGKPVIKDNDNCIKCMLCVIRCPDFAIDVREDTT